VSGIHDTVAGAIARWVTGDGPAALPPSAIALVKRAFVDTIAVTLLGARMDAPRLVASLEPAGGGASLFALGRKADVRSAALVNGTSSHADLFDDNNGPMISHPSGALVSALLPLAQVRGASGREVLQAYAAGFEVGVKLGRALNPGLYERGWHVTRVLGVIGATAACARLAGLDAARTANALGVATSMSSGIRQNFGTMTMPLHVGLTARDAVHAVLLAERGFGADPAAFEGRYGFFQTFAERVAELPTLGEPLELTTSGIIFKAFPSGAPTLAAVDAALVLRRRLDGGTEDIDEVTCYVHPWNAMTLRDEEPRDPLQARVNLRFCVAAALLLGRLTYREFTADVLADRRVQALMSRIRVAISDTLPDSAEFPAELRIVTRQGHTLVHRAEVPPGGSTRPTSDAEIEAKLRDCAAEVLPAATIERVLRAVSALDTLQDVRELCGDLEGERSPS
jgi:2-methylcitrate dehydratase PrpD